MARRVDTAKITIHTARTRGERFRASRLRAGLSKSAACRALGVAWPTLDCWESDDPKKGNAPNAINTQAAAEVYGVTADYLLGLEDASAMLGASTEPPEFREWLASSDDAKGITASQRATLGAWRFPAGQHPGPRFYSDALRTWRDLLELRVARETAEEMHRLRLRHEGHGGDKKPR